jgi:hypothetical protein
MELIEVKLLQYVFRFKPLNWREEFSVEYNPKKNRLRTLLASALMEVSGLKVSTVEEAWKVLEPLPDPILNRVYIIYKGSLPESRAFNTLGLYKAPEPSRFVRQLEKVEQQREEVMDKVEKEMETKFGRKELEEAMRTEREMAKNGGLRGVTKATKEKP